MKRIYIRKGDVFCVENETFKSFFQYVTDDITMLDSRVIRVFQKKYPINYDTDIDEITDDNVFFYVHTFIRVGILEKYWFKVGNSKNIGDCDNIMFRDFPGGGGLIKKSTEWSIWKINHPYTKIGCLTDETKKYDFGPIIPPLYVCNKIKTGDFGFPLPD